MCHKKAIAIQLVCILCFMLSSCAESSIYDVAAKNDMQCFLQTESDNFDEAILELQMIYAEYSRSFLKVSYASEEDVRIESGNTYSSPSDVLDLTQTEPQVAGLLHSAPFQFIIIQNEYIEFVGRGAGFGSNTTSKCLYYVPSDHVEDIPEYGYLPGIVYKEAGGGIYGTKAGSDNTVYIERIAPRYYYVEASY